MVEQSNRLPIIDGLRGFSLLGILMANMLIFQYGIWGKDEMKWYSLSSIDSVTYQLVKIFVEGSFMPIFTFLFGFGMIKMKESLEAKGLKQKRYFCRRFLLLLVAGILHGTFLWEGDILTFYGAMGFFLLIFMNRKAKTLFIWGATLLCLLGLLGLVPEDPSNVLVITDPIRMENYVKETIGVYGSGTYEEIRHHRNTADPLNLDGFFYLAMLLAPLLTAPMFLFGMYAAKKQWFLQTYDKRPAYLRGMLLFLPAGLLLKSLESLFPGQEWAATGNMVGGSILALGYIFAFVLLYSGTKSSSWLSRFEAVGKLSLTNYLLQTVICTTIFYGYGFGWFGRLGVLAGCGLALAIYTVQLLASQRYLTHFASGPVEKLLRMWTYFSFTGKPEQRVKGAKIDTGTSQPSS